MMHGACSDEAVGKVIERMCMKGEGKGEEEEEEEEGEEEVEEDIPSLDADGWYIPWSQQDETQCCVKPPHCRAGVASAQGVLPATCRKQWLPCPLCSEGGPLDFTDTLIIGAVLLLLVSTVI